MGGVVVVVVGSPTVIEFWTDVKQPSASKNVALTV
jgi:hypothetical protein